MTNKKKNNKLNSNLCDNCDYFYRDQEMFRADVNEPIHENDQTFEKKKSIKTNKYSSDRTFISYPAFLDKYKICPSETVNS